jgi:hypothetical protein
MESRLLICMVVAILLLSVPSLAQDKYALTITPKADYDKFAPEAEKWDLKGTHQRIVADKAGLVYTKDGTEYSITCMPAHWYKNTGMDNPTSASAWEAGQKEKVPNMKLVVTDSPSAWLKDNGYEAPKVEPMGPEK